MINKRKILDFFTLMLSLDNVKENKFYKGCSWVFKFLVKQWFFCFLGAFVALAHSYPQFAKAGGMIKGQYSIGYGAVAVIFLVSGMSMSTKELRVNLFNWRAHMTVLTTSFLITSAIIYGLMCGILMSKNNPINEWLLAGLVVTHSCPTTVSSNVVMTKQAHGNDVLTLLEVFIGNLLGAFITPALLQMYMVGDFAFANPTEQGSNENIQALYGEVMKQIGSSVFAPLFLGQVLQNIFPKQVKWTMNTFKLNKVGSFMLLLIMFESFSTAFAQDAFTSVNHVSIIFLCFFNFGIYIFFTVLCFLICRNSLWKMLFSEEPSQDSSRFYKISHQIFSPFYYNRRDTVAIMLCGPAKTAALGVSLVSSQYGASNPNIGKLLVPLVLYQSEQVMTAQVLTHFMRKWIEAEEAHEKDIEKQASYGETLESQPSEDTTNSSSHTEMDLNQNEFAKIEQTD